MSQSGRAGGTERFLGHRVEWQSGVSGTRPTAENGLAPPRPVLEREAHALMGASMGGFGAFNLGIKYRCQFGIIVGFFPAVNLRWEDCHGHYRRDLGQRRRSVGLLRANLVVHPSSFDR